MDEREAILRENYNEYFKSGQFALEKKQFNVSTTLFFKAICSATDLFIFKNTNSVPSSHTNRFRVVQEKFPQIYEILDRDFPFYQDSYTKKMSNESAELMKDDAKRIKEMSEK